MCHNIIGKNLEFCFVCTFVIVNILQSKNILTDCTAESDPNIVEENSTNLCISIISLEGPKKFIWCTVRFAVNSRHSTTYSICLYESVYSTTWSIYLYESVQYYLLYLPIWVGTVLLDLSAYMSRYSTTWSICIYE